MTFFQNITQTKRLGYIDTMKCLLVLWVVLVHINYDWDPGSLPGWLSLPYYMPAFFFLSGVFHKPRLFYEQVKTKALALLIPFCFFYVISYVWTWGFRCYDAYSSNVYGNTIEVLIRSLPNVNYASFNGALWFFLVLFLHSILYSPLKQVLSNAIIRLGLLVALSIFGLFLWSKHIFPLAHFCYFYIFYALGAEYGKRLIAFIVENKRMVLFFFLICFLFFINTAPEYIPFAGAVPFAIRQELAACIFIPIALIFCFLIDKVYIVNKILRFIGEYSIVVFAIHMPYYTQLYTESIVNSSSATKIAFFFIFLLISALFAAICNRYTPYLIGKK